MKKILISLCLLCSFVCYAEDVLTQEIENEKSNANINLNSEIIEQGRVARQSTKNVGSWFNININRNTYKFYYIDKNGLEKTNFRDRI